MRFGSDEVFMRIKGMLSRPDSATEYARLYDILRADTLYILRQCTLLPEEREDLVQEVSMVVLSRLSLFAAKFADSTAADRNAYLYQIIRNKRNDCLATKYHLSQCLSYDAQAQLLLLPDAHEDIAVIFQRRQELFEAITQVCSLRTTPDKIIAFLLNKLTAAVSGSGSNGCPADVAHILHDCTLRTAADIAVQELERVLDCPIPMKVLQPLYEKLAEPTSDGLRGQLPFRLSVRDITDSSSWITSKMKKHHAATGGQANESTSEL